MILEKNYVKIPIEEWKTLKQTEPFQELIEWLEDSMELQQAIHSESHQPGKPWRECQEEVA